MSDPAFLGNCTFLLASTNITTHCSPGFSHYLYKTFQLHSYHFCLFLVEKIISYGKEKILRMFFTLVNKHRSSPFPWESPRDMIRIASLTCVLSMEGCQGNSLCYSSLSSQPHKAEEQQPGVRVGAWHWCGGKVADCGEGVEFAWVSASLVMSIPGFPVLGSPRVEWKLNDIIYVQHFIQCLAFNKRSVKVINLPPNKRYYNIRNLKFSLF